MGKNKNKKRQQSKSEDPDLKEGVIQKAEAKANKKKKDEIKIVEKEKIEDDDDASNSSSEEEEVEVDNAKNSSSEEEEEEEEEEKEKENENMDEDSGESELGSESVSGSEEESESEGEEEEKKVKKDHDDAKVSSKKRRKSSENANGDDIDEKNENDVNEAAAENEKEMTKKPRIEKSGMEKEIDKLNEQKLNFFAEKKFSSLPLSEKTMVALGEMKFSRMTLIQSQAIPPLLTGKDLIGAAQTGSGKTLAFLIPIVELLHKAKFTTKNGTGAIVITPTRELSMQIYGVLQELITYGKHTQTFGLIMGGANRRTEGDRLQKGVNIIICTPGRLLDHLQNTKGWNFRNLLALTLDEADRCLDQGFEDDLRTILKILPKERQTMLFSATQTKKVDDLVRLSVNPDNSVFVQIASDKGQSTVDSLEQGFVTVSSEKRFLLLFTFLKKNKKKKIMVFFSSCNSVKFHAELLNYIDVPVMDIHGRQKQVRRTTTFFQFCKATSGTLLCTDVAARGLDIPKVDWIIQFDPPDDPKEYIHRVGRTARGASGSGRALLFLTPEETGFLKYLKAAKVNLNEYEFPTGKVANVQSQLQRLIETNYYLNKSARDAYRGYLLAYASHSLRDIFNVHNLDLKAVGLAFGFTVPPRIDLAFGKDRRKNKVTGKKGKLSGSGHAFSAENPYGKRDPSDKRQFVH